MIKHILELLNERATVGKMEVRDKLLMLEAAELLVKLQEQLDRVEMETARKIFSDIDVALDLNFTLGLYMDSPEAHYYEELGDDIKKIKKKYKVED